MKEVDMILKYQSSFRLRFVLQKKHQDFWKHTLLLYKLDLQNIYYIYYMEYIYSSEITNEEYIPVYL